MTVILRLNKHGLLPMIRVRAQCRTCLCLERSERNGKNHVKKDSYAVTALTKIEHAEAVGNACHCVMIMSDISVLSFLSRLMYVMDALTETGAALKKDFTRPRKLRQDTENRCLNQEQGLTLQKMKGNI